MVLGDLRSSITLVETHTCIMVSEGRRVYGGPVLTRHLDFFFFFSFWDLVDISCCRYLFCWIRVETGPEVLYGRLRWSIVAGPAQSRVGRRSFPLAVAVGERIAC
jgi:hypothetical protein